MEDVKEVTRFHKTEKVDESWVLELLNECERKEIEDIIRVSQAGTENGEGLSAIERQIQHCAETQSSHDAGAETESLRAFVSKIKNYVGRWVGAR